MRTTHQMSITIPFEMANAVKAMVQNGFYASESEVVRDGIRVLIAREKAIENWLLNNIVPAYDELVANPNLAITLEQMIDDLEQEETK